MSAETRYRAATLQAEERKAAFRQSLADAKARVAPARLMADARASAVNAITDIPAFAARKARQRPIAVGAAASALLIYAFRQPIGALFTRLHVRWKNRNSETYDG